MSVAVDRFYDPSTAQFLSIDPDLPETGQPDAYTADDPLNSTDPLGLKGGPGPGIADILHYGCSRTLTAGRAGQRTEK